ncbi:MAG: protein kinase [Rhodobacterales bacterium]|nr:protein kinase [Rhodobacterales bacterium]
MASRFEVLEIRASGAYATVCRARVVGDPLARDIALKAMKATLVDNARALMRTRDEARLLAKLNHPNIVRVEGLLSMQRRPVLVMEWVEGLSLRELMNADRRGMAADVCLELVARTSKALDDAWNARDDLGHPLRIIHRDIKPGNLLVSVHGELKVVDFGLSCGEYFERETTTVSTVLGSMGYMAPERFASEGGDHPSVDTFALGLTLGEILTGRLALVPRDKDQHDLAVADMCQHIAPRNVDDATTQAIRRLVQDMCRFDHRQRPSHTEVRERVVNLQESAGLSSSLSSFASQIVEPVLNDRPSVLPRQHYRWDDVSFLEGTIDEAPSRKVASSRKPAEADAKIRRLMSDKTWAARKRELKWLLALHTDWSSAPFLEVLQRTTRPWWHFWSQPVSTEEAAVALELLKHRPIPAVRPFAVELAKHRDKRVSDAACILLERIHLDEGHTAQ